MRSRIPLKEKPIETTEKIVLHFRKAFNLESQPTEYLLASSFTILGISSIQVLHFIMQLENEANLRLTAQGNAELPKNLKDIIQLLAPVG